MNTLRAAQQRQLDELRDEITKWHMVEKLSSAIVQNRLALKGFDFTIGQIHVAFKRFGLKRPRVTNSARHLAAVRNREYPNRSCKHCSGEYRPQAGNQMFCEECVRAPSDIRRIRNYGVSYREFRTMLAAQHGLCCICTNPLHETAVAVDHDHVTLKVRGLLCKPCNLKLSVVEDVQFVLNAQAYLMQHRSHDDRIKT